MKFSKILLPSAIITATANAAAIPQETKCNTELNAAFEELHVNYAETGQLSTAKVPDVCFGVDDNKKEKLVLTKRNPYNSFCSATEGTYNRYLTCYAIEESIVGPEAAIVADTAAANINYEIFNSNGGCTQGLFFMPDATNSSTGWNVWYEVITPTADVCNATVDTSNLATSLSASLVWMAETQKSAACIVIQPPPENSNNTLIRIRSLYSTETLFQSVIELQCPIVNQGYILEPGKC